MHCAAAKFSLRVAEFEHSCKSRFRLSVRLPDQKRFPHSKPTGWLQKCNGLYENGISRTCKTQILASCPLNISARLVRTEASNWAQSQDLLHDVVCNKVYQRGTTYLEVFISKKKCQVISFRSKEKAKESGISFRWGWFVAKQTIS